MIRILYYFFSLNKIINRILKRVLHDPIFLSCLNHLLLYFQFQLIPLAFLASLDVNGWFSNWWLFLFFSWIAMPKSLVLDGFYSLPNVKLYSNLILMYDLVFLAIIVSYWHVSQQCSFFYQLITFHLHVLSYRARFFYCNIYQQALSTLSISKIFLWCFVDHSSVYYHSVRWWTK